MHTTLPYTNIFGFGVSGLVILINLALLSVSIYVLILLIKLARRGITALDIYIEKNRNHKD